MPINGIERYEPIRKMRAVQVYFKFFLNCSLSGKPDILTTPLFGFTVNDCPEKFYVELNMKKT
jgi:hypothetical protein